LRTLWIACLTLVGNVLLSPATRGESIELQIVAHGSVPASSLSREALVDLFLKRTETWIDGTTVHPVDLLKDSPLRKTFSRYVLERNVSAVESYWRKQVFSGTASPPLTLRTTSDVLDYIGNKPGAIGYVATGAALGDIFVKKITIEVQSAPIADGEIVVSNASEVEGKLTLPIRTFSPPPQYTEMARRRRLEGVVEVKVIISSVGSVKVVEVLEGLPAGLTEAAVRAVERWRYEPATVDGAPVAFDHKLTVQFRLQR
jgi:TonB family protein